MKVSSAEFQQNFDLYQDAAQADPVEITKDGQVRAVLMSATHFELVTKGRLARAVEDLDEETVAAIATSSVSPEFDSLDGLLEGWEP
jgi:prevent-host-death family protein